MSDATTNKEIMRLTMQVKKADAAKAELDFKIAEKYEDIERMKEHSKLQDGIIEESSKKLKELKGE